MGVLVFFNSRVQINSHEITLSLPSLPVANIVTSIFSAAVATPVSVAVVVVAAAAVVTVAVAAFAIVVVP